MMTRKNKTTGRSMIEMLGVLAIIGVLSAGGIMGYSAAMENYKVNKTVDMMVKLSTAAPQYFVKRSAGTEYAATEMGAQALCQLGVIPSEICNNTSGLSTAMLKHRRKGYFGETVQIYLQQSASGYTGNMSGYIVKNDGSGGYAGVYGPATRTALGWWVDNEKIGKSACIKIVTSPAWKGLGKITHFTHFSPNASLELPLSVANAKTACDAGIDNNDMRIYSYSEGQLR